MASTPQFHSRRELLDRLSAQNTERSIVFLVGAPISAPITKIGDGVSDVAGVIELIRGELASQKESSIDFEKALVGAKNKYISAFEFLILRRGQDVANKIIRRAVLRARYKKVADSDLKALSVQKFDQLESDVDGWALTPGARALGQIVAGYPERFGKVLLTSNFDPILEVSIRKAMGRHFRTILQQDGDIDQTKGDGCHVIHFHGYWHGKDTLHTTKQLTQPRPQLQSSLAQLVSSSTVVVMAYGGWDDAVTKALASAVATGGGNPDILWTFFESDEDRILTQYENVIDSLAPGIARGRTAFFKDINCHEFLPELGDSLSQQVCVDPNAPAAKVPVETAVLADSPPRVEVWVGRTEEYRQLSDATEPVCVISGIGGQGKSALAAIFVDAQRGKSNFDLWDWRDCKEEGDKLRTQLVLIIEKVSGGAIRAASMESENIDAVLAVFFQTIKSKKCLFVFDNIDHYIDLEKFQPTGGMDRLFDLASTTSHQSRFIFTCRPTIKSESASVRVVALSKGLSFDETKELFAKRGASQIPDAELQEAYDVTEGHPLWLNLLALQVSRKSAPLKKIISDIKKGRGDLPEKTLRSIWATLKEEQQYVLRTMAEVLRPATEEQLGEFVAGAIQWNRFSKTMRTLKALNLVVVKARPDSDEQLELHPLISRFIRREFPKQEQELFVGTIITFYDRLIGKFRALLIQEPELPILENWIYKAELNINRGNLKDALDTIAEVRANLLASGFPEEFIRIARRLFEELDWSIAVLEYKEFDSVFNSLTHTLVHMGEIREVERLLEKYKSFVPGKSAKYIHYCTLKTYAAWFTERFAEAIRWGEEGERLAAQSKVDTQFTTSSYLALARRDSGEVEKALSYFLEGRTVESVSRGPLIAGRSGEFYGNIGRCLFFMDKSEDALNCYKKSAQLLEKSASEIRPLNQGYARLWIAEALQKSGNAEMAYSFFRAAIIRWKTTSPIRADKAARNSKQLEDAQLISSALCKSEDWQHESRCNKWLNG